MFSTLFEKKKFRTKIGALQKKKNQFYIQTWHGSLGIKKIGLDGIETYYPYDRFRGIVKFSSRKLPFELAKKYNLIQTGGSDEHGCLAK